MASPAATVKNADNERQFIVPSPRIMELGYKKCRKLAKEKFPNHLWPTMNLPSAERGGIMAMLFVLRRCVEVFHSHRFELVGEYRDDINDAMCGRYVSSEWMAVHDCVERFKIPRQYLFDLAEGVDHAIRFGQPASFDDLMVLAARLGGGSLNAAVRIMGVTGNGFDVAAIRFGQALLLTEWLMNCRPGENTPSENFTCFLAQEDLEQTGCTMAALQARSYTKPVAYLVRLYAHRIEQLFIEGAALFEHLDFDCTRAVRGLAGAAWKAVVKLRQTPEVLFDSDGVITPSELFGIKARYLLGLDPELPFVIPHGHHAD